MCWNPVTTDIGNTHLAVTCFCDYAIMLGPPITFCQLFDVYPGKADGLFPLLVWNLWCVQWLGALWPEGGIRLFAHYNISSSSLWRHIRKYRACKNACHVYSSECVSKISISIIFYVFSLPISRLMIVRIFVLHLVIIIKSEIWIIRDCYRQVMKQWYAFYVLLCSYIRVDLNKE